MHNPNQIHIFPLKLVLVPGESVPLNIFEIRYIDLMKTCLSDNRPFGICCILDGNETDSSVKYETVGCSAKITNWEMPKMGIYHIEVLGQKPFTIEKTKMLQNGLIEAEVSWLSDSEGNLNIDNVTMCNSLLKEIFGKLNEPLTSTERGEKSARWVSYRLAEFLASNLKLKQQLLEERVDAQRIAKIISLLGLSISE